MPLLEQLVGGGVRDELSGLQMNEEGVRPLLSGRSKERLDVLALLVP